MGRAYQGLDRHEEAVRELRAALELRERTRGASDPGTLESAYHLAYSLRFQYELDEAETLTRRTLAGQREVLGKDHPSALATGQMWARILYSRGDYVTTHPRSSGRMAGGGLQALRPRNCRANVERTVAIVSLTPPTKPSAAASRTLTPHPRTIDKLARTHIMP